MPVSSDVPVPWPRYHGRREEAAHEAYAEGRHSKKGALVQHALLNARHKNKLKPHYSASHSHGTCPCSRLSNQSINHACNPFPSFPSPFLSVRVRLTNPPERFVRTWLQWRKLTPARPRVAYFINPPPPLLSFRPFSLSSFFTLQSFQSHFPNLLQVQCTFLNCLEDIINSLNPSINQS